MKVYELNTYMNSKKEVIAWSLKWVATPFPAKCYMFNTQKERKQFIKENNLEKIQRFY